MGLLAELSTQFQLSTGKHELSAGNFYRRLTQTDQDRVQKFVQAYEETLSEEGRSGVVIAVGGSVYKQHPRKDIDLVLFFDGISHDRPFNYLHWDIFRGLAQKALARSGEYESKIYHPSHDGIYGLWIATGRIIAKPLNPQSTDFDLIRWNSDYERGWKNWQEGRPFAVLAERSA